MANARMNNVAQSLRPEEWTQRVVPNTNLPAFTLWHCARATDGTINFLLRGVPEVAERDPWRSDRVISHRGAGTGFTLAEADDLAGRVSVERVLTYAADVRADAAAWLKTVDDEYLDTIPDYIARRDASPVYGTPAYVESMRDLDGQPVWRHLITTCYSHVWSHLEEVVLLVGAQRRPPL